MRGFRVGNEEWEQKGIKQDAVLIRTLVNPQRCIYDQHVHDSRRCWSDYHGLPKNIIMIVNSNKKGGQRFFCCK